MVVRNAIFGSVLFEDLTVDQWRRMLEVHLDGGYLTSRRTGPCGRRVAATASFISSSAGMFRPTGWAHYAAAKAGLVGLMNVNHRHRGRGPRHPGQFGPADRLFPDGHETVGDE